MSTAGKLGLLFLCSIQSANAYELSTHTAITFNALQRSKLASADQLLLKDLGIDGIVLNPATAASPFGSRYFNNGPEVSVVRTVQLLERRAMRDAGVGEVPESMVGWLMRGVIREDDTPRSAGPKKGSDNDPEGNIFRVFNHFYDPVNDKPLNSLAVTPGLKAPDWALGTDDVFADPSQANENRRNHFSVLDARDAMWRALTLTGRNADGTYYQIFPVAGFDTSEQMRKAYWATTFRSLGDVLHLNQDMAQPQHTRNEAHSGFGPTTAEALATGHESAYEKYIEARATNAASFIVDGGPTTVIAGKPLPYWNVQDEYPIPVFKKYSDFWSTAKEGSTGVLLGKGLADYSNRGFFTAANNFGDTDYQLPISVEAGYSHTQVQPTDWQGMPLAGAQIEVYSSTVFETVSDVPDAQNVPLTSRSIWDQFMTEQGKEKTFTLNRLNYDAMADLLIPRAVAYSAGILDYFFRGQMQISLPAEGVFALEDGGAPVGFRKIKVNVKNTSAVGEDMTSGDVVGVLKFRRNNCYLPDLSGEYGLRGMEDCRSPEEHIVVSDPASLSLVAGAPASTPVTFDFSDNPLPFAATDVYLQVVYRGRLGQEADAVVVATLDISEPTPFDIVNMTDYFLLNGTFHPIPAQYNATTLLSQVSPELFTYIDADRNGQYDAGTDRNLAQRSLQYTFDFGFGTAGSVTLPPSSYARMLILTTKGPSVINLHKLTYNYSVPISFDPLIKSATSNSLIPLLTRGSRYVYYISNDHSYFPNVAPVTEALARSAECQSHTTNDQFSKRIRIDAKGIVEY